MERGKRKLDGEMGRRPVIKDLEAYGEGFVYSKGSWKSFKDFKQQMS